MAELTSSPQAIPAITGRRVIQNTMVLSIGETTTLVAGLFWTIIIARYVGPEVYGFYAFVHATLSILAIFVNLGLDRLLTRDIAQKPAAGWPYFVTFTLIKTVLSALLLGGYLVYVAVTDPSGDHVTITLILTGMWFVSNLFVMANAFLYAYEAMHYAVIGQALNAILTLATGALAVWLKQPFAVVLWLSLGASIVQVIVAFHFSAKFRLQPRGSWREVLLPPKVAYRLLVEAFPFAALILIAAVNTNLIVLLLRSLTSDFASVGYLSAAQRIYSMAVIVPSMLARALFPAMASAFTSSPKKFADICDRGYRYITFFTMPLGIGLCVIAPYVLDLIYGPAYAPAIRPTQILALVLSTGIGYGTATALEAMRRQTLSAVIFAGLVACNVVVGYWAIPYYGAEGAAFAILLSAVVGFFIYAVLLFRLLHMPYPFGWVIKTAIASVVMGVVAWWAVSAVHFLVVAILIAPLTYVAAHIALGTLSFNDWKFLLQVTPLLDRLPAAIGKMRGQPDMDAS